MGHTTKFLLLLLTTSVYVQNGSACSIEGLPTNLGLLNIMDTDRGIMFQGTTTGIQDIVNAAHGGDGVSEGPYFSVSLQDDQFALELHENFVHYEEYNTASTMSVVVTFSCTTQANNININFIIDITDTNNNAPTFLPSNEITFQVTPPLPPGYLVTGCLSGITVRDIDLTTYRIDFNIEDNEYFTIEYDEASSQEPKMYGAILRTTTFIRSIPEPITLWITATDVDLTGDAPITTTATIRIEGDEDFTFPEEPVFSQVFYMGTYTTDNDVLLPLPIFLQQGYDDIVRFNISGEHASYFDLVAVGNTLSILVTSPLPRDVILLGQLLLELSAEREYTSGATATLVLDLPEDLVLQFAEPLYEASIVDGTLTPVVLTLTQGYEHGYEVSIIHEHNTFFPWTASENVITISMLPLDSSIIEQNSFITLQVLATSDSSSGSTIVSLDIVKDDTVTPVFEESLYTGTYDPLMLNLRIGPLILAQGLDATVTFDFESDYTQYGELVIEQDNTSVYLEVSSLPQQVLGDEQHIFFTIIASKPRTVGATTTVAIAMPQARVLSFAQSSYTGQLEGSILTLETIVLSNGYTPDVLFRLVGDYATYFEATNDLNEVTVILTTPLPEDDILNNNFITLTLEAIDTNAITGLTNIVLDVIKQDIVTPVFSKNIYDGTFQGTNEVQVESISLSQGYDNSVNFRLDGDHSQYFAWSTDDNNNIVVSLQSSIPEELIFELKVLVFNIVAEKPLTVGANAAIAINFPSNLTEPAILSFGENVYVGSLENDLLSLETIVLEMGFATNTYFTLAGDYASYFIETNIDNVVTITQSIPLPPEIIASEKFITLELQAQRERAVTTSTAIVIEVIVEEVTVPVFSGPYYTGTYTSEGGLVIDHAIYLAQGYDSTVIFELEGEYSVFFDLEQNEYEVRLFLKDDIPLPEELVQNYRQVLFSIVATKPNIFGVRAAVSIDLPDEASTVLLRFAQSSYVGRLDTTGLQVDPITLLAEHTDNINFTVTGEYSGHFTVNQNIDTITLVADEDLPLETILNDEVFIILDIEASRPDSISATTTVVFEVIRTVVVEPVFERTFYAGSYSNGDLLMEGSIQLVQGYDETVLFSLDENEADSQYFSINQDGNRVDLTVQANISEVLNRSHLVTSVIASKPGTSASAAIVISLEEASTVLLRFAQSSYVGRLDTTGLQVDPITLLAEHTDNINFTVTGEYSGHFTVNQNIDTITLEANEDLPLETILNDEVFIILDIEASRPDSISATTTVVFEVIRTVVVDPVFERTFYAGSYSNGDLLMEGSIQLVQGYDETVLFSLDGNEVDSQYFSINQVGNRVDLTVQANISEVLNRSHLVTSVIASKPGTSASAAIVISLEASENTITFSQVYYTGTIEDGNGISLEEIRIEEGYTQDMDIVLLGENQNLFRLEHSAGQGDTGVVQIYLDSELPAEVTERILIFTLEARSGTETAYATIVFELVRSSDETGTLVFEEAHYLGSYSENGLSFDHQIRLTSDFDTDVLFWLEGENNQYFNIVEDENNDYVTISLNQTLPEEVIQNNQQVALTMVARAVGYLEGRTAIVIALGNDPMPQTVLRFSQTYYSGQLESTTVNLERIVISEGYNPETTLNFDLRGDLAEYFEIIKDEESIATYYLAILLPIPEELMENRTLTLIEVEASAAQAISALTTIVLESDPLDNYSSIIFAESFYTGSYSDLGFVFENTISLETGYSDNILFTIEEEYQQWFTLEQNGNAISLILTNPIPLEYLLNNHNLIFTLSATGTDAATATTTIIIALESDLPTATVLRFQYNNYRGSIDSNIMELEPIILSQGYTENVTFTLIGDTEEHFDLVEDGPVVTIIMRNSTPDNILIEEQTIILELEAASPESISAYTTIVLEFKSDDNIGETLVFSEPYYTGRYTENSELIFEDSISLSQGYDETVTFDLEGDHTQWFQLSPSGNTVSVILENFLPAEILAANQQLLFVITANKTGSPVARSAIFITLPEVGDDLIFLRFERTSYLGQINLPATTDIVSTSEQIILSQGYNTEVSFSWTEDGGELREYFYIQNDGPVLTILQLEALPEILIPANYLIVLGLQAYAPQAISTHTTILIRVILDDEVDTAAPLTFSQTYYTGYYSPEESLVFENIISLSEGYDESINFELEGEHVELFTLEEQSQNSLVLRLQNPISSPILENNNKLIFEVTAERPNNSIARAPIIISLIYDVSSLTVMRFDAVNYRGILEDGVINLSPIILSTGYSENVQFNLQGELASYFRADNTGPTVTIIQSSLLPEEIISNKELIVFDIIASETQSISALAAIILEQSNVEETPIQAPVFSESFYVGQYHEDGGLVLEGVITLAEGYDDSVEFDIQGDDAQWFIVQSNGNSVELIPSSDLSVLELAGNYLTFSVIAIKPGATTARAGIFITLQEDSTSSPAVAFDKALYTGVFELDAVRHEVITVSGYTGLEIGISGAYSDQFEASATDGTVSVLATSSAVLPEDISHVALELQAGSARAALVLDVSLSEVPSLPTVTFSAPSYEIRTDVSQTGLVGRVQATADNDEQLTYAVLTENVHLLERLSVSDDGELHLFAPANSGRYDFSVTATTVATQVSASALVRLSVDAIMVCDDDVVVAPLIILDRDEEEPHSNLVILDGYHADCWYSLTNRWPVDQDWLFVNETGLHARAIDREDSSIAFMALSQVQVELILHCDNDSSTRLKRSLSSRLDWLGPYDYGNSKWALTDSISYNSRRSLVNLIVNDINDNDPIFVGKENEPIAVGYPIPELLDVIMPRALAELKATDADIGENAALMYWSLAPQLAVAPSSGTVHVRDNQREIQEGARFTVHATDRNGEGNTGDIDLMVRLLDVEHIAVLTIRDAFQDDEAVIISDLTSAIGYDVKVLTSMVISDEYEVTDNTEGVRSKRQAMESGGASLRLYVYGMVERDPVDVNQLTSDISSNVISSVVVDSISLQDYLDSREECLIAGPGRDTGLLVATIVLSVLLFILILFIALWFFLKWWKSRNYDQFSDANSLASRTDSVNLAPKPDTLTRPRLNIDELKRSERRLQEMLEAPVNEVTVDTTSKNPLDTKIDVPLPENNVPIVIQSIDKLKDAADSDDDEYGEVNKPARRKSVVTFNENVEKIIHVEDPAEDNSSDIEIERL